MARARGHDLAVLSELLPAAVPEGGATRQAGIRDAFDHPED